MKRLFRILAGLALLLILFGLCAAAGAEVAQDITGKCSFKAGSGRKTFYYVRDRNYKTYWRTSNGDKGYVEVTVRYNLSASGVMVQWYEPGAFRFRMRPANGSMRAIRTVRTWRNTFPCRKEPFISGSATRRG